MWESILALLKSLFPAWFGGEQQDPTIAAGIADNTKKADESSSEAKTAVHSAVENSQKGSSDADVFGSEDYSKGGN